ncbi:hypothetical protein CAPTEDRAFT_228570 [Capitella teleta]|uniref:UDENN domain-containing protein n=1 Tax=Capitella teleta TaxID=283909 RepID=R7VF46_CAPTE|nr:hypothetical protein CAPTEDRAFT_228570 [Capitella teleta]|eukprot:ELU14295.1 hypothetical protein CAPTEDRAFT_228570 [Capitella teleta]
MSNLNRLIDYFIVSGLSTDSGLEPDQLSVPTPWVMAHFRNPPFTGDSLHCPPLDRPYKPHVLSHFPVSRSENPLDKNAVGMLCHPRALRFQTQQEPRDPAFHSFIITKENGSRVFGAALTYYEVVCEAQICKAMQTLQSMHMAELSNTQSRTLYSHLTENSTEVHQRSPLVVKKKQRTFSIEKDTLYATKCMCILSQIPLIRTFERILVFLYNAIMSTDQPDLPFESHIFNLIFEVPMPPLGGSVAFTVMGNRIIGQRPGSMELPLLDYPLHQMLLLLNIDKLLLVFSSILLEHQVIFYSKDYLKLMLVSEGLTALLFPFRWQHVYVPILPTSVSHFLDAPVPFIMGLHHGMDSQALQDVCANANICFVDIDTGNVDVPDDLPVFPYADKLRSDVEHELRRSNAQESVANGGNQRDSGFRESLLIDDSGVSSAIPGRLELIQNNEALAKITALAQRTGVISSLDDLKDSLGAAGDAAAGPPPIKPPAPPKSPPDQHVTDLIFNSAIREIFLHYFLQIFRSYESFVINSSPDLDTWLSNRETMQNFDRAAFLSDHSESHLPFLSAFIETQMFTTFIDNKIIAQWEEVDSNLRVFEDRLQSFREVQEQRIRRFYRTHLLSTTLSPAHTECAIEKRANKADLVAPPPKYSGEKPKPFTDRAKHRPGVFPELNTSILDKEPPSKVKRDINKWRKKGRVMQQVENLQMEAEQREKSLQEARAKSGGPSLTMNPAGAAQTNWKFVESLLKECKAKTKRMLVEKMGQEAVELGHGEAVITGVEENTLIASLCDLLERIWSHGRHQVQGKSALWSHLLSYQETYHRVLWNLQLTPHLPVALGLPRKPSRTPEIPILNPLPSSLLFDLKNVQQMSEIKTEVGYTRAFVRLALEKKLLSKHLKQLLSNPDLLRSLYKSYGFLRCEDEREQFLYHLLSLNAVDYYCYTNAFSKTVIGYQVLIFTQKKMSGGGTSANCWLSMSGSLGETKRIPIPKHTMEMNLQNKNLGVLTTMRVGHDNAGMSPKWMVEHILVRNEITGHAYRFPCGRPLGKGVDDGALERLLVAEMVPPTTDHAELLEKCRTPPRCRSPSMPRRSTEPKLQVSDIQEMLGDAVNNLVKHFYKPEKERGSLTSLLCGEYGLVFCMEHVFQCGFKSSRFLRNRFFVWDFLEKVSNYFHTLITDHEHYTIAKNVESTMKSYCHVVNRINSASEAIGKDGRFQIFICIGVRERYLQRWLRILSKIPITSNMYEEQSFLRDPALSQFVTEILGSLKDFNIVLEASLIKGITL